RAGHHGAGSEGRDAGRRVVQAVYRSGSVYEAGGGIGERREKSCLLFPPLTASPSSIRFLSGCVFLSSLFSLLLSLQFPPASTTRRLNSQHISALERHRR